MAQFQILLIAVGLVCFLVAATALSKAGQLATSLRPLVKRSVLVHVWGLPLPATNDAPFRIESISALSAGLRVHLRPVSGGPRSFLKVAQPRSARVDDSGVEIRDAAYVSWAGTKIKPNVGSRLAALTLVTVPASAAPAAPGANDTLS